MRDIFYYASIRLRVFHQRFYFCFNMSLLAHEEVRGRYIIRTLMMKLTIEALEVHFNSDFYFDDYKVLVQQHSVVQDPILIFDGFKISHYIF